MENQGYKCCGVDRTWPPNDQGVDALAPLEVDSIVDDPNDANYLLVSLVDGNVDDNTIRHTFRLRHE